MEIKIVKLPELTDAFPTTFYVICNALCVIVLVSVFRIAATERGA